MQTELDSVPLCPALKEQDGMMMLIRSPLSRRLDPIVILEDL